MTYCDIQTIEYKKPKIRDAHTKQLLEPSYDPADYYFDVNQALASVPSTLQFNMNGKPVSRQKSIKIFDLYGDSDLDLYFELLNKNMTSNKHKNQELVSESAIIEDYQKNMMNETSLCPLYTGLLMRFKHSIETIDHVQSDLIHAIKTKVANYKKYYGTKKIITKK